MLSFTDCGALSSPADGEFREETIDTDTGSLATPVCNNGFTRVSTDIQHLVCTLWGEWAAVDRETRQLKTVDWEYEKRHAMCKRKHFLFYACAIN